MCRVAVSWYFRKYGEVQVDDDVSRLNGLYYTWVVKDLSKIGSEPRQHMLVSY